MRVELHDTGRGIPAELHERFFEPFFRLVDEMGGELREESEPGRGTVFHLRLPTAFESSEQPLRSSGEVAPRRCVLILADDPVWRSALRRMLREHEALAFEQGPEALAQVASGRRFDAILCKLRMPEMSGPRFYEELVRLAPEQAQRVIFFVGDGTEQSRTFLAQTGLPCLDIPIGGQDVRPLVAAMPPLQVPRSRTA